MRDEPMNRNLISQTVLAAAIGLAMVAGCNSAEQDRIKAEQIKAFLQQARPPVSGAEYRVMPPDVLSITSLHVPEINAGSMQVRPDGKINLPLIGEIMVADSNTKQIEEKIVEEAKKYYLEADATVQVAAYRSQVIYVYGQVGAAGPMPWTGNDTLLDVLDRVQPNFLAWPERIRLVRPKNPKRGGYVPSTQPAAKTDATNEFGSTTMVVDLMAMIKTGDLSQNVLLLPGDIVYVPPTPMAAIGLALERLLYPVRPVMEAVRLPSTVQGAVNSPTGQ